MEINEQNLYLEYPNRFEILCPDQLFVSSALSKIPECIVRINSHIRGLNALFSIDDNNIIKAFKCHLVCEKIKYFSSLFSKVKVLTIASPAKTSAWYSDIRITYDMRIDSESKKVTFSPILDNNLPKITNSANYGEEYLRIGTYISGGQVYSLPKIKGNCHFIYPKYLIPRIKKNIFMLDMLEAKSNTSHKEVISKIRSGVSLEDILLKVEIKKIRSKND